jgi:hypothetical protein
LEECLDAGDHHVFVVDDHHRGLVSVSIHWPLLV